MKPLFFRGSWKCSINACFPTLKSSKQMEVHKINHLKSSIESNKRNKMNKLLQKASLPKRARSKLNTGSPSIILKNERLYNIAHTSMDSFTTKTLQHLKAWSQLWPIWCLGTSHENKKEAYTKSNGPSYHSHHHPAIKHDNENTTSLRCYMIIFSNGCVWK